MRLAPPMTIATLSLITMYWLFLKQKRQGAFAGFWICLRVHISARVPFPSRMASLILNVFGNHGLQVAAGQLAVKLGVKELGSPSRHGAV